MSFFTGEVQGNVSATRLEARPCSLVQFRASDANSGKVYIGVSGVTKPTGANNFTTGVPLSAGEKSPWIPVSNLREIYYICDGASDDFTFFAYK